MKGEEITYDGRRLSDARVLAKLTIGGLAKAAKVAWMTISRLETGGTIRVTPQSRHGCVSSETWGRITAALQRNGVELLPEDSGGGIRWYVLTVRRNNN